jgi:hypothetical protein
VLYDLVKGDERVSEKFTALRSQLEVKKVYTPKNPQVVIYKKNV